MCNLILGVESSCDETGVAIYDGEYAKHHHQCRASALHSQAQTHAQYGGVVPELASREHILHLQKLTKKCLEQSSLTLNELDGFAYTQGPGLAGALLTGASYARALAYGLGKPCLGIHHMEGHLLSPMMENPEVQPPFLGLLISGGHTLLVEVQNFAQYRVMGQSVDDAVGEAFDKSAKLLGLGYPGGYPLSQLARSGDPAKYAFSRPMTAKAGSALSLKNRFNFSFSGLKTEVRNTYYQATQNASSVAQEEQIKADIAASFEQAVADTLSIKVQKALDFLSKDSRKPKINGLLVAGGVAANTTIREKLQAVSQKKQVKLFIPKPHLCTDNADMIAYVGWLRFNRFSSSKVVDQRHILPRWELEEC